jgi:SPP1 family predicted phage head-tail adaptor
MRAGAMRDRVKFKTKVVVEDGSGGRTETWVEAVTVWGNYTPFRGTEKVEGDRTVAQGTGMLRIRHSAIAATLTEQHVAEIDGVDYQIRNVENFDRRNRAIEMFVERGVIT